MAIVCKSAAEIEKMRRSGGIVRQVLDHVRTLVVPGATTMDLERAAEQKIKDLGVKPAFKGYYDYPCVLCTSINEEIVHGIPSEKRVLKAGDIVSIDCGVVLDGYYGDAAITVPVDGSLTPGVDEVARGDRSLVVSWHRSGPDRQRGGGCRALPYRSLSKPTASAWCGSLSDTALERACTKSRKCRTMAPADTGRACAKAWCWPSSLW
jgi:hypothetical protein